jgi:ComF family protein
MYRWKRLFRLYNQSQLLAEEIGKIANIQVINNCLEKVKWTKSQSLLSRKARKNNLQGSFAIFNSDIIRNKKVILVDDVRTTSSTINICSRLLKKSGAASVFALTVAVTSKYN